MTPTLPEFPEVNLEKGAIEGVWIKGLVEKFGSPLFIFSERIIKQKASALRNALEKYYPNSQIAYSIETNSIPSIISILKKEKSWAKVGSSFEYWLAKRVGFPDTEIIWSGTDKEESVLFAALENGATVNCDNFSELERVGQLTALSGKRVSVGLQINVHVGLMYEGSLGFELHTGEAYGVVKLLNKKFPNIHIGGLYAGLEPHIEETKFHVLMTEQLSDFALKLKRDFGLRMAYLDLGHGIPAPGARPFDRKLWVVPEASEYIKEVAAVLHAKFSGDEPLLYIEPGQYVVDESGMLLTTVLDAKMTVLRPEQIKRGVFLRRRDDAKDDEENFQLADVNTSSTGTMPTAFARRHNADVIQSHKRLEGKNLLKTIVRGNSSTSNDFLGWDMTLPKLFSGDHLLFYNAGAYEICRSRQFSYPRPAVVLIRENGHVECVRKKESFEHMVALDEF